MIQIGATVLVLGNTGLLGQAVERRFISAGYRVLGASRKSAEMPIDITDGAALARLLRDVAPAAVINCAALVDIEQCEADYSCAWAINAEPLIELSRWSRATARPLVHVSTDQFFSGDARLSHAETHAVTLLNNYAKTKYAGELLALSAEKALVLRTAIIGIRGWEKPTFAEWALDVVCNNRDVMLFADAFTSAIDTGTFVDVVYQLLNEKKTGLYNVGSAEVYSKAEFVIELAKQLSANLTRVKIGSVTKMSARRSDSLGLDVSKVEQAIGKKMPTLEEVAKNIILQHNRSCHAI